MNTTPKPSPTSCADLREEIKRIVVANTRLIDNRIMLSAELADRVLAAITPAKPVEGDVGALIERLNAACVGHPHAKIEWPHRILHDAASALASFSQQLADERAKAEQLTAKLREAQEALAPFADAADSYEPDEGDGAQAAWAHDFTIGSLRRARLAARASAAKSDANG